MASRGRYRITREWSPSLNDFHYVLSEQGETAQRSGNHKWAEFQAAKLGIEIEGEQ